MEIDRKSIDRILKSQEIIDSVSNMLTPIRQNISDRESMFTTAMQPGGGLEESQLIDGEPVFFNSANDVKNQYTALAEKLNIYESDVTKVSIEKEREELTELKRCLEKDLEERTVKIQLLIKEYYAAIDKASSEGIDSTAGLKDLYWNPIHGLIPIEEREKKYDEETLIIVNNRLSKLGEPTSASTSEETTSKTKGTSNYQIDTTGDAKDIYESACSIRNRIGVEIEYLDERIAEVEYNLGVLEKWHNTKNDNGSPMIDDETYNRLKNEYETLKSTFEDEKNKREKYYEELVAATKNNFGTHDGPLKDAQDWNHNDVETSRRIATELNYRGSTLTPINDLMINHQGGGISSPMYPAVLSNIDEQYRDSLSGLQLNNQPSTYVSNTTMEAAHRVAESSNTITTFDNGNVEIFSSSNYIINAPDSLGLPIHGRYMESEYDSLQRSEAYGNTSQYGDTVYDKREGKYYSLAEYMATHPDFKLDM